MKKRLVIVIWNMGIGGVQKRVRDITLDLTKNYPDWDIYLLIKFKGSSEFLTDQLRNTRCHIRYFSPSHKKSNALPSVFWITWHILTIHPAVCLTFLDHLSVVMTIIKHLFFWRKLRLVLNEGVYTSTYLGISRKFYWKYLVRLAYPHADLIITPTKAGKKDLSDHFHVPPEKISVIPNWTLIAPLSPLSSRYDLIYIGRFEKEKNIFALLDVMELLHHNNKKISLIMIGKGKQKEQLLDQIRRMRLSPTIFVRDFTNNITDYLRRSKLFVLSTHNEGLPNVVLEAAMCQLPSVVNNFEGASEAVLHGKTGYIAQTTQQMAKYIQLLLDDPSKRKKLGKAAQQLAIQSHGLKRQTEFIRTVLGLPKE